MTSDKQFHVYVDYTADEGIPFYVGKGNAKRLKNFGRNKKHANVLAKHGLNRKIVWEGDSEADAFRHEIRLIAELHTFVGDPLADSLASNFTAGGDGPSGYKLTPEQRARRSASQKIAQGRPEQRAKKSASQKIAQGRPETRAKNSASQKIAQGRPETRAKKSTSLKASPNVKRIAVIGPDGTAYSSINNASVATGVAHCSVLRWSKSGRHGWRRS